MDENLLKAFATLAACVGGIVIMLLVTKKIAVKKNLSATLSYESVEIIAKIPLPPKGLLYVIAAGGKRLLVGSTEQSITLIADVTSVNISPESTATSFSHKEVVPPSEGFSQAGGANHVSFNDDISFSAFLKTILSRDTPRK